MSDDSYLFYGGPWHNKIVAVPAGRDSYQVVQYKPRRLSAILTATDDGFNPIESRIKTHEYRRRRARFADYDIKSTVSFQCYVYVDSKNPMTIKYDEEKVARMCLRRGLTPVVSPW